MDRGCYCESNKLGEGWIPISIHPNKYGNEIHASAIDTLEALLSVAEKYKIPMVTRHKDVQMGNPLVRHDPK
jgi:hypothetical protein